MRSIAVVVLVIAALVAGVALGMRVRDRSGGGSSAEEKAAEAKADAAWRQAVLVRQAEAEEQQARNDISSLHDAVTIYVMKNRRLPTLDELVTPNEKGETYLRNMTETPTDPWGTPYEIRRRDSERSSKTTAPLPGWERDAANERLQEDTLSQFDILSYGRDRRQGTEDDIASTGRR